MSLGKILCLHGFVQNGTIFSQKSSGVRKALSKLGYELVYLTAPVKINVADLPFEVNVNSLGGDANALDSMRSWWPNSESAPDYYDLDPAFDAVRQSIEENGPYTGVMGFSQGAGLAGVLCQHIQNLHPSQDPLKFAIFYSGFRLKPERHQHFYDHKIKTPSIHIVGSLDTVVSEERVKALWDACDVESRTELVHPGGHFVPNGKDMVTKLANWLLSNTIAPNTSSKEEDDSWDQFDSIGKA